MALTPQKASKTASEKTVLEIQQQPSQTTDKPSEVSVELQKEPQTTTTTTEPTNSSDLNQDSELSIVQASEQTVV